MRLMSFTDPIDQVGRGAGGETLGEMGRHADELATFFAEMAAVTEDEITISPGAGMDDARLFEACKQARVPGLMVGDERMSAADMRRALVAAVKREVAARTASAIAAQTPVEPPAPVIRPPHVPLPPAPVVPADLFSQLEPSRVGKYKIRLPNGEKRRYAPIGGHMNVVFEDGDVDLATFPRRDVEAILQAGIRLEPVDPVMTTVSVRARLDVGLDAAEFERRVAEAAEEIAADMARAAAQKVTKGKRGGRG